MFAKLFLAHPHSVDETYFQHQLFALRFAGRLLAAGLAALTHAFLPFAFETTASRKVHEMARELEARGRGRNPSHEADALAGVIAARR